MTQETGLTLLNKERPTLIQLALINMPPGTHMEDAARIVTKEIVNLEMILETRPELKACTQGSMLQAVKQTINDNLSLAPSAGLVYLYPSHVKTGFDSKTNTDIKEWVMQYDPTANGRLSRARQAGRILDNKRPVPTFDATGKVTAITVEFLVPSYPAPRWEVLTFHEWNFERWKKASAAKNGTKGASGHYTSHQGGIDPEFAASKAIRHGLSKLGTNMNERTVRPRGSAVPEFTPIDPVAAIREAAEENGSILYVSHTEVSSAIPAQASNTEQVTSDDL